MIAEELIEYIQDYLNSKACEYENCYLDKKDAEEVLKILKQQLSCEEDKEDEKECDEDCLHCRWATCPLTEPPIKQQPYSEKIKETRDAYKEGYLKGYDEGYTTGEAQADTWLVIEEHIDDALDEIKSEIAKHRRKTESIDPYDLVGDCLDIINEYKEKNKENRK